jgi:hypothetical protein
MSLNEAYSTGMSELVHTLSLGETKFNEPQKTNFLLLSLRWGYLQCHRRAVSVSTAVLYYGLIMHRHNRKHQGMLFSCGMLQAASHRMS